MATARKHWFRVADSLTRDPLSNDELATLIRLMGALNTRWARDGLNAEEACSITFRPGDLESLTGCRSLARARRIVHALTVHVSLVVEEQGTNTSIKWPKYAEFQHLTTPTRGKPGEVPGSQSPPPQDAPARRPRKTPPRKVVRADDDAKSSREKQLADPGLPEYLAGIETKLGIRHTAEDAAVWLAHVTPDLLGYRQRNGKRYTDMKAAARAWWRRARPDDMEAARKAAANRDFQARFGDRAAQAEEPAPTPNGNWGASSA